MAKPDFGWMIHTCKSHESMQGPGTVHVITAEAGGGWVWERVMASWVAHHTSLDTCLHMLLLALLPALRRPGMSKINQLGDW